jgi:hypothetical protein
MAGVHSGVTKPDRQSADRSDRRSTGRKGLISAVLPVIPAVLLVLVGAATYANSLSGPFIYDDEEAIEENTHLRPPWSVSRVLGAPPQSPLAGRPVVGASFALNYAAGELDVRGYHTLNIAIHILVALVLFGIVRRTLLTPAMRSRFERAATGIAFACALLWLVHPLQTEVVNYTTQRTESLMGLFYFLTLYCAIRPRDGQQGVDRHLPVYGARL